MKKNNKGLTLIELLIVLAIITILGFFAVPRFVRTIKSEVQIFKKEIEAKSEEETRQNLQMIRSAISLYYADHEGTWPGDLTTEFGSYLPVIPLAKASPLANVNTVTITGEIPSKAGKGWAYIADVNSTSHGRVFANSIAKDTKGNSFTTY